MIPTIFKLIVFVCMYGKEKPKGKTLKYYLWKVGLSLVVFLLRFSIFFNFYALVLFL